MKVIKKGTGQKGWAKELSCTASWSGDKNGVTGCDAVLLVEEGDIVSIGEEGGNYRESGSRCYGFICPECDQVTKVNNLPQSVTNKLKDNKTHIEVKRIMGW